MIPIVRLPERAPPPDRHRRFRLMVATLIVLVAVLLSLQSTSHAILPAAQTDSLWGVLCGMVAMTILVEVIWARARRKSDRA